MYTSKAKFQRTTLKGATWQNLADSGLASGDSFQFTGKITQKFGNSSKELGHFPCPRNQQGMFPWHAERQVVRVVERLGAIWGAVTDPTTPRMTSPNKWWACYSPRLCRGMETWLFSSSVKPLPDCNSSRTWEKTPSTVVWDHQIPMTSQQRNTMLDG